MLLCLLAAALLAAAYLIWLLPGEGGRRPPPGDVPSLPAVDLVVPLHDELPWITAKLRNVRELDYPADRLKVWIVDGGSRDGTAERAAELTSGDARCRLLRLAVADKILQLNAALERARGEWIMVSDADAALHPQALRAMVRQAASDPGVLVVGTTVRPAAAHPLERLHWRIVNRLRLWESRRGSAAIVTAPSYLFRRSLLRRFPADVAADDVHVAFAAAARGGRVQVVDLPALELRSPLHLGGFLRHKFRKAAAYLREIVRFLPRAPGMRAPARPAFLWQAVQAILVPPLALAGSLGAAAWLLDPDAPGHRLPLVLLPAGACLLAAAAARGRGVPARILLAAALGGLLTLIVLAALVSLPFSRPTASYPKVHPAPAPGPAEGRR